MASFEPTSAIVQPPPPPEEPTEPPSPETGRSNVAVTVAAVFTTQGPTPEQPPPLQPVNIEPEFVAAARVTMVPSWKLPLQVAPQLILAGVDVTAPEPVPTVATNTVNVLGGGGKAKVTVTVASPVS